MAVNNKIPAGNGYYEMPTHCQRAAEQDVWNKVTVLWPSWPGKEGNVSKLIDSPIMRDWANGGSVSNSLARRAMTAAMFSTNKDDPHDAGDLATVQSEHWVDLPVDLDSRLSAENGGNDFVTTDHVRPGNKISPRKPEPSPLHPVLDKYKQWLQNGASQDCQEALKKAGLWDAIVSGVEKLKIIDINPIADEQVSKYLGSDTKWNGKTFGQYWPSAYSAKTRRDSGQPGIYVPNGVWAFSPSVSQNNFYWLLHENAHWVQRITGSQRGQDLDLQLGSLLGVVQRPGDASASAAVKRFFDNKCNKGDLGK